MSSELDDGGTWNYPFEAQLADFAPDVQEAQRAWLGTIDSLRAPDRKTHELIRMVCTVLGRNTRGVARHARFAAELGATWEEVAGSIVLTEPAFGLLPAVEALPWARRGWERGRRSFEDGSSGDAALGDAALEDLAARDEDEPPA